MVHINWPFWLFSVGSHSIITKYNCKVLCVSSSWL